MSSITNLSNKKGTFRPAINVACTFAILCLSYLMLLIPIPDDTLVFFSPPPVIKGLTLSKVQQLLVFVGWERVETR